jgi:ADP-ribose pyrophosphatase YjhB (NUDIX family)
MVPLTPVLLHRSGVAHGGHFEGVRAPRLIHRSEFRFDACDLGTAGGLHPQNNHPTRMQEYQFEPWQGRWYIPSGFVEYGDDVEETARREVREETGLLVELGPLSGVYSYFDDPRQNGIIVLYRALIVGGALEAGDDAAEVAFFTARALPPPDQIGFATHRRASREWSAQHYRQ